MTHHSIETNKDTVAVDEQMCALKRDQDCAVKRVTFIDTIYYDTTMAYSTIHGTLPKLVVATAAGTMKAVSTTADHYTGQR